MISFVVEPMYRKYISFDGNREKKIFFSQKYKKCFFFNMSAAWRNTERIIRINRIILDDLFLTNGFGVTVTVKGSKTTNRTITLGDVSVPWEQAYLTAWCERTLGNTRVPPRTTPSPDDTHTPFASCFCQLLIYLIY